MRIEIQIPNEKDIEQAEAEVDAAAQNGVPCLKSFIVDIAKKYSGAVVVIHVGDESYEVRGLVH